MVGQRIPLVSSHSSNPSDLILDVRFSGASILKAIVLWSQSNGQSRQYFLSKRLVDKLDMALGREGALGWMLECLFGGV